MNIFGNAPDPDDTNAGADPASAAAENQTPAPTADEAALAAFDAGLEAAVTAPVVQLPKKDGDGEEAAQDDEENVELDADGNPIEKPAQTPEEKAEADKKAAEAEAAKPDADTEKAITEMGLKGKSAERFRSLTKSNAELLPYKAALDAAGIKDVAEIADWKQRIAFADEFVATVQSTGANDDQFGAALGYLAAVNSGDPAQMRKAFDAMKTEQEWLAKELGIAVPGVDPLDAFPDLLQKVKDGKMDREDAEQAATDRAALALTQKRGAQQDTRNDEAKAVETATSEIKALAGELYEADKLNFSARLKACEPGIKVIQSNLPPGKWKAAIKDLYDKTPAPAKPKAKPVTSTPLRPTGADNSRITAKPNSDMAAFEAGLEAAGNRV